MTPKLTLKQRKFWAHFQEHHNKAAAAKHAGCTCTSVSNLSHQGDAILNSLQLSMPELLNAMGLTDELLAQKTFEGLNATRTQLASYEGKFKDEKITDDQPTRAKYLELLGRMKGAFIDRHELTGKDGGEISISYAPSKVGRKGRALQIDDE